MSCAAHTVSSGGARRVRAVPLMLWAAASSVLEEPGVSGQSSSHRQFWGSQVCPGGSAHGVDGCTVSSGGARCVQAVLLTVWTAACQFWGSQVCPGGPTHTVSSGGAGCVWAVLFTPSVLGEPGVSRWFCSWCGWPHHQFWGSQVCPGGPAHTISSRGARCVREVPLTPSVLGEPGVSGQSCSHRQFWGSRVCPGGSAHGVDGHTISSGGAKCARAVPLTVWNIRKKQNGKND